MTTYVVHSVLVNVVTSEPGKEPFQYDRYMKGDTFESDDAEQMDRYVELGAIAEEGADPVVETPPVSSDPTGAGAAQVDGHEDLPADPLEEEVEPEDYSGFSYPELQAEAKSRDLPANGTTEDLVNRLQEHDKSNS